MEIGGKVDRDTESRRCMMITISKENYLKAIAEAEAEGKTVISALLAHWLSVTPPAVTAALKRLRRDGLVTMERAAAFS